MQQPRVLALLSLCLRLARAKRCDVFNVPGRGRMCGPAAFMPAFGKCGTNAFMAFTSLHPHVKWPEQAEITFDPAVISPGELISRHSPGVLPDDPNVWMIKDPTSAFGGAPLVGRLLTTYPSAALFVVACDPTLLPFRWYRHYMERTIKFECDGVPCPGGHSKGDPAGPADILRFVRPRGVPSLIDLYARIYPFDSNCVRDEHDEETFRQLRQMFRVGMSLFGPRARCLVWDPTEPSSYLHTRHDLTVLEYVSAGYQLGESMDVFFMEGWGDEGVRYLERIHHILQLPLHGYPWAKANHFLPVYSISQMGNEVGEQLDPERQQELSRMRLDNLSLVPVALVSLQAAVRECCAWLGILGTMPPWDMCDPRACAPPAAPPPAAPPVPSPAAPPPAPQPPLPTSARLLPSHLAPLLASPPAAARPARTPACDILAWSSNCGAASRAAVFFAAGCACLGLLVLGLVGCRLYLLGSHLAMGGKMLMVQTAEGDDTDEPEDGRYGGYGTEGEDEGWERGRWDGEGEVAGGGARSCCSSEGDNGRARGSPGATHTGMGPRAVLSSPRAGDGRGLPIPSASVSGVKRDYVMDD